MTVAELCYGRGTPASAKEIGVDWPAFFAWQRMDRDRTAEAEEQSRSVRRGR